MPGSERSEIYFIAAMMLLTLILSISATYIFVKTYKKEMREKEARRDEKNQHQSDNGKVP
jgi:hypothetical protein